MMHVVTSRIAGYLGCFASISGARPGEDMMSQS